LEDHVDLHLVARADCWGGILGVLHGNPGNMVENDGQNWENVGRTWNINGKK